MRRRLACALGAFTLGWVTHPAIAQDIVPPPRTQPAPTVVILEDGKGPRPEVIGGPVIGGPAIGGPAVGGPTCGPVVGGPMVLDPGCWNDRGGCRWHWELGGGVYWIQPNFETNPAFVRSAAGSARQTDFTYHLEVAPLGWLAWTHDCGAGARGRWFQYDHNARERATNDGTSTITSAAPWGTTPLTSAAAGDALVFGSKLRVEAWDLEATYTFVCNRWSFLIGAGARYASTYQSYNASLTTAAGATTVVNSFSTFYGAGPSFALESKRRIADSGFAVYGNARGSILFGSARQVSSGVGGTNSESHQSDVLPIGELEVGLEWGRDCGRFRVFAQTGFVGQVWWGNGNAANVNVGAATPSNASDFGFVGAAFRLGFNF